MPGRARLRRSWLFGRFALGRRPLDVRVGLRLQLLLPRRAWGELGPGVLQLLVEVDDRAVDEPGGLDMTPAARHVTGLRPPRCAVAATLGDPPQWPNETADGAARGPRKRRAGRRLVKRRKGVGEARHRAADAD